MQEGAAPSLVLNAAKGKDVLATLAQAGGLDPVTFVLNTIGALGLALAIVNHLPFKVERGVSVKLNINFNLRVQTGADLLVAVRNQSRCGRLNNLFQNLVGPLERQTSIHGVIDGLEHVLVPTGRLWHKLELAS